MLKKALELTGMRFGKWTALERSANKNNSNQFYWLCRCDCGATKYVTGSTLKRGTTRSCGCLNSELSSARMKKHGMSGKHLYIVWNCMMSRCYNSKDKAFSHYGGRGIKVCEEWKDFTVFHEWAKPLYIEGTQLDREDNDLGYAEENCRFVSPFINACNKRKMESITGFTGVSESYGKFRSQVNYEKTCYHLGSFPTIREAVEARNNFIVENNFPHKLQEVPEL